MRVALLLIVMALTASCTSHRYPVQVVPLQDSEPDCHEEMPVEKEL